MNCFILLFITAFGCLYSEPSIVLVHLGNQLPSYLTTTLSQIRLFNPDLRIYLIGNQEALNKSFTKLIPYQVELVVAEDLPKNCFHKKFCDTSILDKSFRNAFWTVTTERFFYIASLIEKKGLENVFHIENDIMLYVDLKTLMPVLKTHYKNKIAATFDNDNRCIPGFIYIASHIPLDHLINYISRAAAKSKDGNDMKFLAGFKNRYNKKWIDSLPILMPEYSAHHELVSPHGEKGSNSAEFSRHFNEFKSIFDAAAIGQYLGGTDPKNGPSIIGFINESCIFNPSKWTYEWLEDEEGRKVPYAVFNGHKWRINNLHIHSKNLSAFLSKAAISESL